MRRSHSRTGTRTGGRRTSVVKGRVGWRFSAAGGLLSQVTKSHPADSLDSHPRVLRAVPWTPVPGGQEAHRVWLERLNLCAETVSRDGSHLGALSLPPLLHPSSIQRAATAAGDSHQQPSEGCSLVAKGPQIIRKQNKALAESRVAHVKTASQVHHPLPGFFPCVPLGPHPRCCLPLFNENSVQLLTLVEGRTHTQAGW